MGIREDIQTDLAAEFSGDLSDSVKSAVLRKNEQSYVPGTGVIDDTSDYNTRLVSNPVNDFLVDGESVLASDRICVILQNELSATPDEGDSLIFDGKTYVVRSVKPDPADATWEILARET